MRPIPLPPSIMPSPDRQPAEPIDLGDVTLFGSGDHHAVFAHLRRHHLVYWNPELRGGGFWVVSRYAAVVAIYQDTTRTSLDAGDVHGSAWEGS